MVKLPNGISRRVKVNEKTGHASWVVFREGKYCYVPGTINKHNVFIPYEQSDHKWIMTRHKAQRVVYNERTEAARAHKYWYGRL